MVVAKHTIVERQVKEWLARTRRERERDHASPPDKVITISGQYGAKRDSIGQELVGLTGFTLFDRSIIQLVAERAGTLPSPVEAVEDVPQTYFDVVFSRMLDRARLEQGDYARHLAGVLGVIGAQGGAIVLGRGANVLLGAGGAFRVRVVAPLALRIQRIAAQLGLDPGEAERRIVAEDRRRKTWIRTMLGQDIDDPQLYDLVLNTEVLTPSVAARVVKLAAEL